MARISKTQEPGLILRHDDYMRQRLQDPKMAEGYLKATIAEFQQDGDFHALMRALHRLAEAKDGVTALAKKTHLSRQNLYKIFNATTTPKIDTVALILSGLGYRLSVVPKENMFD